MSRRSNLRSAVAATLLALPLVVLAREAHADTQECETYFAAAANAGSPESIAGLYQLEALCRQSRSANAPIQNEYCNCPVGSHCASDGNSCVPSTDHDE